MFLVISAMKALQIPFSGCATGFTIPIGVFRSSTRFGYNRKESHAEQVHGS